MTATARLADYVFGCKLSLEKPGTSRTAEGQLDVPFAQYTPALVHPDFDVIEEWEFFWGLAHRMRTPLRLEQGALDSIASRRRTSTWTSRTADRACRSTRCGGTPAVASSSPSGRCASSRRDRSAPAARMDVAPPAVIAQLRAIRAEPLDRRLRGRRFTPPAGQPPHARGLQLDRRPPAAACAGATPTTPRSCIPPTSSGIGVRAGEVVRIDSDHDFIYGVARGDDRRAARRRLDGARARRRAGATTDGSGRSAARPARLVSVERDFEPISGMPRQSAIPVNVRALEPGELATIAAVDEAGAAGQ